MEHFIYGLLDPDTKELRYIGYTSNIIKRYKTHHNQSNLNNKSHKNDWIKSLLKKNKKAEIIILEQYDTANKLPQAEIELIEYFKYIGANLTNGTIGGDGVQNYKHSKETKKIISEANKGNKNCLGNKLSDEHKQILSKTHKGKPSWNKGIPCSEEHKKKQSQTMLGRIPWNKGKKFTQESKDKMSKSHKGLIPWNKGIKKN